MSRKLLDHNGEIRTVAAWARALGVPVTTLYRRLDTGWTVADALSIPFGVRRSPNRSLADRFWEKVEKTEGCWLWTGATGRKGYGQIGTVKNRHSTAHRVAWELANGPIPDGLWVLHRCDNPPCVNPAHLFLGTHEDNMRDMWSKGRGFRRSRITHCKRGHELSGDNLYRSPPPTRRCRACALMHIRAERAQRNESRRNREQQLRQPEGRREEKDT